MPSWPTIASTLRRYARAKDGSIAVLSALVFAIMLGATALAIDVGALYLERRSAQGAVDLAAIAGASDLGRAEDAVRATLQRNGISPLANVVVTRGQYIADTTLAPALRFQAGALPYNAVRVDLDMPGRRFFSNVLRKTPVTMSVRSLAANAAMATFSIGSRLASVRDGLINQLLGGLLGTNVSLWLMDYNALASTDVRMNGFLDALAAQLKITGATYGDVLNAPMAARDVFAAAAAAAAKDGNASAATALATLARQSGSIALSAPLSTAIDLGPMGTASAGQATAGLGATMNLLGLVVATATLANGTNLVSLDLGASVPGLLSLKADVAIGARARQSPWIAVGQAGATIATAQARLRITAEIGGSGLLAGARIRLPIGVDAAFARATLSNVSCSQTDITSARAAIAARPGVVRSWIGETPTSSLANLASPPVVTQARMMDTGLIVVTGRADVSATNTSDTVLQFSQSDVDNRTVRSVQTSDATETLVASLLDNLALNVQAGGLGLGLSGSTATLVTDSLRSVAAPIDQVLFGLLDALGVHVGEADVRVNGIRCGSAVLLG